MFLISFLMYSHKRQPSSKSLLTALNGARIKLLEELSRAGKIYEGKRTDNVSGCDPSPPLCFELSFWINEECLGIGEIWVQGVSANRACAWPRCI